MKKVLFLLFSLLILFVGKSFAHEKTEILMTPNGFEPKNISIQKGEEVVFVNKDKGSRWPASNLHPTHLLYPEFDPKKPIPTGGSWSFVFNKVGNWRMHDHLHPEFTGTIEVKGVPEKKISEKKTLTLGEKIKIEVIKKILLIPGASNVVLSRTDMLKAANDEKELEFLVKVIGPQKLMQDLLKDAGGGSLQDCHTQAHKIGRATFNEIGASAFSVMEHSCHSGYVHGAMEAFLAQEGTDNLAKKINDLCSRFKTSFGNFECLHGVGHGILAYYDYDLPAAIKECEELGDDFAIRSCYGGMFMENIVTAQGNGASGDKHSTKWVNTDPYFPCDGIDQKNDHLQYECYQMQTSWMQTLSKQDFDSTINLCANLPDATSEPCFRSLGRDIAGSSLRDPNKILSICGRIKNSKSYSFCIVGADNVIIDFWGERLGSQASDFCSLVKDSARVDCYKNLIARIGELYSDFDKKKEACSWLGEVYKRACFAYYSLYSQEP